MIESNELLWLYSSVMFATNNVIINLTEITNIKIKLTKMW